jgi:hypothetical protein
MRKFTWFVLCLCLLCLRVKADKSPTYGDLRDSVDFQLHAVKQTLTADRPGVAYLEVVNNSSDTIYLKVSSEGPEFLTVDGPATVFLLLPRNSFVFSEKLLVAKRISPGVSMVLYKLEIGYTKAGKEMKTSKIITQEVEMGILGESGIMTILGLNIFSIPFFLVLPGFLFVVIWAAFLPPAFKTQQALLAPDKKESFFWVAAITLSLLFTLFYALISGQSVWISYGLLDVIYLWVGSISLAIVSLFILNVVLLRRASKEAAKDFTHHDTPMDLLERLQKRGADLFLDQGGSAGAEGFLFDLGVNRSPAAEAGTHWYGYGILAKKIDSVQQGSNEEKIYKKLVELLRALDTNRSICDPATLISQLKAAQNKKVITLEFEREPGIVSPLSGEFTKSREKNIVHT